MNHEEFQSICSSLGAPNRGWQKAAVEYAQSLGHQVCQPTISLLYNNPDKSITPRVAQVMHALADAVASGNISAPRPGQPRPTESSNPHVYKDPDDDLTDEEIIADIADRFQTFDECIEQVVCGTRPGVVVSSPPGSGKSHCVDKYESKATGHFEPITGDLSDVNLYMALYRAKDGGVLAFDDCDGVFDSEVKLNLLKGALEVVKPGKSRNICWLKESKTLKAAEIPNSFDFQGRILFMTNIDFDRSIERDTKIAEHLKAFLSRCGYLSLGLHSTRRRFLRIVQVHRDSNIMADHGITDPEIQDEIINFIDENRNKFRDLSLRMLVILCHYRKNIPSKWKKHAHDLLLKPRKR